MPIETVRGNVGYLNVTVSPEQRAESDEVAAVELNFPGQDAVRSHPLGGRDERLASGLRGEEAL